MNQNRFQRCGYQGHDKTGGIFPLLAEISALIAAAAPAIAKVSALGTVGTAAGMAPKKATGKGYQKKKK